MAWGDGDLPQQPSRLCASAVPRPDMSDERSDMDLMREEIAIQRRLLDDIHARVRERLKHMGRESKARSLLLDICKLLDAHAERGVH